ncbi:MAG: alpha-amylase family glycosyl hydrolase [Dokdonella sp.]
MIDRFDDGNPDNNDQGALEYDPTDASHYSGGDLAGLDRRIDYIRGLGATALWITPPVANQWWDARTHFSGYHGYWAENFAEVDAHYGTLEDYRRLSRTLHAAGMYLVQDIVINHVGNFFSYPDKFDPRKPQRHVRLNRDARPNPAPTQYPFSLNNPRRQRDREAAIYHWTPAIRNFDDAEQQSTWQLADLDDLDTGNPVVRKALRQSYAHWIREVGVDAFRVDTAFYVPQEDFSDFLCADDADAPGILNAARETGRDAFHVFGEGFGIDRAYADEQARRIDSYMRDPNRKAVLPGMLNFPLYGSTLDVFARGRPTAVLAHRIANFMRVHADPHRMPSFIDNHDVDRFLASASVAALKQSLLLIMTLPGIPVIYYGTEQGFTEQRASMFARGHGANGRDHFDVEAPLYRYIQRVTGLRRAHAALSRGSPQVIDASMAGAGVLAYCMHHEGHDALIVFNSAEHEVLLAGVDSGLAAGTALRPLFSIDGEAPPARIDGDGRLTMRLAPRNGWVWIDDAVAPLRTAAAGEIFIEALATAPARGDLEVRGHAHGIDALRVVVDGDLERSLTAIPDQTGHWRARVDTADFTDPSVEHRLVAWSDVTGAISTAQTFRVEREWTLVADVDDPTGDDRGPRGRYRAPDDPVWRSLHPLDLSGIRAWRSGGALRIEVRMRDVVADWKPANGFDHVALTLFLQVPGGDHGIAVMPLQNASVPGDMRWTHRLRVGGWNQALFAADGASAKHEGTPLAPSGEVDVDREHRTITLTLPAAALGRPSSLAGARMYVTTWDYDGGYRPLIRKRGGLSFSGGDGTHDPLVMDDSALITLR